MFEFIENLFNQIDPLISYMVLFISSFAENVLPPVPGDTVVVIGAYLVSIGKLGFWGVYVSTTLGSLAGFTTMYLIGRQVGRRFISKRSRTRIFKEEYIYKVEVWFSNWGYWVIAANRFLSGTRSVISVFSGIFHLNMLIVLMLATVSASFWNALLISGGLLLGNHWHNISNILSRYNQIVIVLILVIIGYFLSRRLLIKYKKQTNQK